MESRKEKQTGETAWQKTQDRLAERASLSILLVDGHQPPALAVSNNNSICRVVQSSATHAERCEPFCGAAFQKAIEAGEAINYRCHAGLYCVAAPIENAEKPLVAIVGRTFLKTSDYRDLTERIFLGDWQNLPEIELFENVNLSGSIEDLEKLAARLQNLNAEEKAQLTAFINGDAVFDEDETIVLPEAETFESNEFDDGDVLELEAPEIGTEEILILDDVLPSETEQQTTETIEGEAEQNDNPVLASEILKCWREKSETSVAKNYHAAVTEIVDFIAENFDSESLAWFEERGQNFKTLSQRGARFGADVDRINLKPNDERLIKAAENKTSLRLENKNTGEEIELFPIRSSVGEIHAAIVVADGSMPENARRALTDFLAEVVLPLEVLRLREEVETRARLQAAIKKFNAELQNVEAENFLDSIVENIAALVGAERCSLLYFDENERVFRAAAAVGRKAEEIKNEFENLGERIAVRAYRENAPIVAADTTSLNLLAIERGYQSDSFLILPLSINGKVVGVLNLTDKNNDAVFDEIDLQLLEAIAPQTAIALDRALVQQKAGEFKTASITDALTDLPNRRYLELRLEEEVRRSQRHGYPLNFMMIDVDYFKKYNDLYGHQAGDEALQIVAKCLRAALRAADIAARYGGEEFSILLPQTTQSEAYLIAERIRRRIETTVFPHAKVTISVGIASYSPQLDAASQIIKAADEALYAAKSAGRNNVQIYRNGNGNSV